MAYAHTSLSIESSVDVVGKYRELIEELAGGDSLYVRAREVVKALKEDNLLTNGDEGTIIAQVVASLSGSASSQALSTALQWETAIKEISFKKEEMEYRIDQMKLEAQKLEFDRDNSEAAKHYTQAKMIREMGAPIIVNGDVASLPNDGSAYYQLEGVKTDNEIKEKQSTQVDAQTKQINAQVHKLVADTYVNHGLFTGYTIESNGITGASKIPTPGTTLSEMNLRVAAEQAKGYTLNAYGTAASSSAGMIGTLIAAEVPNLDMTPYLSAWKVSIDKLNGITIPAFTQSALSL